MREGDFLLTLSFLFGVFSLKSLFSFKLFRNRTKFLIVEITSVTIEPFVLDDNGLIVEHWDNKEVMPKVEDLTNRGKF
mgnify:CR=1 FL=1